MKPGESSRAAGCRWQPRQGLAAVPSLLERRSCKWFPKLFGAEWAEVLDVADKSFTYNAANNAYFAVRNLRPVENLTLEQLLEKKGIGQPPNIIVS